MRLSRVRLISLPWIPLCWCCLFLFFFFSFFVVVVVGVVVVVVFVAVFLSFRILCRVWQGQAPLNVNLPQEDAAWDPRQRDCVRRQQSRNLASIDTTTTSQQQQCRNNNNTTTNRCGVLFQMCMAPLDYISSIYAFGRAVLPLRCTACAMCAHYFKGPAFFT